MHQRVSDVTEGSYNSSGSQQEKTGFHLFKNGTFNDAVDDGLMIVSGIEFRPKTTEYCDVGADLKRSYATTVISDKGQPKEAIRTVRAPASAGANQARVKVTGSFDDVSSGNKQVVGRVTVTELTRGTQRQLVSQDLFVPKPIQIFLQDDNTGKKYEISVLTTITVHDLMVRIYRSSDIVPQEMTYDGQTLTPGNSLESYGIRNRSIIHFTYPSQCCCVS